MPRSSLLLGALLLVCTAALFACNRSDSAPIQITSDKATPAESPTTEPTKTNQHTEVAIIAGGCFWGVEELMRKQPGVVDTSVGYTGGNVDDPGYDRVKTGVTGHAESVRIEFDPKKTSYEKLLLYFFTIHDPTTKNRQGNDVGTQYRSAIFVQNAEQRRIAEQVKTRVDKSGQWDDPVTTEIVDAGKFFEAEGYHQDYLQKNPGGYTCHYEREVTY